MEPRWWRRATETESAEPAVRCGLCVHECLIRSGAFGCCGARGADENGLVSPWLGRFSSAAVDPIEKKPLYHWRPGSRIFSLGSLGCNMRCPFCQNHAISRPRSRAPLTALPPEELAARVRDLGLTSVAYTYNEPALQAEYILEAAPLLAEAGVATVLVTNGLISPAALGDLAPWIAAANVDLKTWNPAAYARMGGSLDAVRRTVASLLAAGTHVELTTLVVPGISDDPDEFAAEVAWIADLSPDIPLHLSRYFPAHEYTAPPTDLEVLRRFRETAETRLKRVHLGNVR